MMEGALVHLGRAVDVAEAGLGRQLHQGAEVVRRKDLAAEEINTAGGFVGAAGPRFGRRSCVGP